MHPRWRQRPKGCGRGCNCPSQHRATLMLDQISSRQTLPSCVAPAHHCIVTATVAPGCRCRWCDAAGPRQRWIGLEWHGPRQRSKPRRPMRPLWNAVGPDALSLSVLGAGGWLVGRKPAPTTGAERRCFRQGTANLQIWQWRTACWPARCLHGSPTLLPCACVDAKEPPGHRAAQGHTPGDQMPGSGGKKLAGAPACRVAK